MKQNCYKCVHSTRLYYECSTKYDEFQFKPTINGCYCTLQNQVVINHKNCKAYLKAYDHLNNRLREEDIPEDNLPF